MNKQQQVNKKNAMEEGIKRNEVKHIAQRDFKTSNRFDVLADENEADKINELQGIKVNIDVACEMGLPIDEEVSSKWPEDLQQYYKNKCLNMQKDEKIVMLQNKVKLLDKKIVARRCGINANVKKKAEECVTFEMEDTGNSRNQAFGVVYDKEYRKEMERIEELVLKKQVAEIEVFILSDKSLDDDVYKGWSDEMKELYEARIVEIMQNGNLNEDVSRVGGSVNNEVGMDLSAHAEFITQNIVSNAADVAMAGMVSNAGGDPSSSIQ